jgi:hypothetical protein
MKDTIFKELLKSTSDVVDWSQGTIAEMPPLVREILTYGKVSTTIYALLSLLAILIGAAVCKWAYKNEGDPIILPGLLMLFFGFWGLAYNVYNFLCITLTPRLYIIDYVNDALSKN